MALTDDRDNVYDVVDGFLYFLFCLYVTTSKKEILKQLERTIKACSHWPKTEVKTMPVFDALVSNSTC